MPLGIGLAHVVAVHFGGVPAQGALAQPLEFRKYARIEHAGQKTAELSGANSAALVGHAGMLLVDHPPVDGDDLVILAVFGVKAELGIDLVQLALLFLSLHLSVTLGDLQT